MGALTILPAAIAKVTCRSVVGYMGTAVALGALNAVGGAIVARRLELLPGPTIILLGVGFFVVSLAWTAAEIDRGANMKASRRQVLPLPSGLAATAIAERY